MVDLKLEANGLTFSAVGAGDPRGELVLFIHGFPDDLNTFEHQLTAVGDAGYHAVSVGLRGYEPSAQPQDGDYSLAAIATDVVGWMDALGADKAHLVGHDWGAAVTYMAAAHHHERLLSATALAIPPLARIPEAIRRVPRQFQRSWYMNWLQLPGLGPVSTRAKDWFLLRHLWRSWSPGYMVDSGRWARVRKTFGQPGVLDAAIAYYRQNATPPIMLGLKSTPATIPTPMAVPVLIINGVNDGCMDRRLYAKAIIEDDFPCGVRHEELDRAGHFVHWEQPDAVNEALIEHLGG